MNLKSVIESYMGRTKELEQCEGYLKEIIELINKDRSTKGVNKARTVYRDAEPCRKLEETLTKFFKVSEIKIYWKESSINAGTFIDSRFMSMQKLKSPKNGVYPIKMHIIVNEQLVYYANLNERELMAVLLHEIGHNFYYNPLLIAGELLSVVLMPPLLLIKLTVTPLVKFMDVIGDYVKREMPTIHNISASVSNFFIEWNDMSKLTNTIFRLYTVRPNLNLLSVIGKYGDERGADTMCAKYGYGPEQATALNKMQSLKTTVGGQLREASGDLGDALNDTSELLLFLIAGISGDPHPNNNQRALVMLRKLERDLKDNAYPPEMKKDLEKEVVRMRKIYNTMNEHDGNVKIKKAWYDAIGSISNGNSDLREIFDAFYTKYEF